MLCGLWLSRIRRNGGFWEMPAPMPGRKVEASRPSWVWWRTSLISKCIANTGWAAGLENTKATRNLDSTQPVASTDGQCSPRCQNSLPTLLPTLQ